MTTIATTQETQPGMVNGEPVSVESQQVQEEKKREQKRMQHEKLMEEQAANRAAKLVQKEERKKQNEEMRQAKLKRKAENFEKRQLEEEVARANKRQKKEERNKEIAGRMVELDATAREKLNKECEVVLDMTSIAEHFRAQHADAKVSVVGTTPSVTLQFDSKEGAKAFLSKTQDNMSIPITMKSRPVLNRFRTVHFEMELEGKKMELQEKVKGILAGDAKLGQFPVAFVEVIVRKIVVVQFEKEEDVAKVLAIMADPAFRFDGQAVEVKMGKPGKAQKKKALLAATATSS